MRYGISHIFPHLLLRILFWRVWWHENDFYLPIDTGYEIFDDNSVMYFFVVRNDVNFPEVLVSPKNTLQKPAIDTSIHLLNERAQYLTSFRIHCAYHVQVLVPTRALDDQLLVPIFSSLLKDDESLLNTAL
jgi:hypothetical protein